MCEIDVMKKNLQPLTVIRTFFNFANTRHEGEEGYHFYVDNSSRIVSKSLFFYFSFE